MLPGVSMADRVLLSRLVVLAAGVLLMLLAFAWQVYGLWGVRRGDFIDEQSLKLRSAESHEGRMGLEQVAALHLFGNPAAKPAEPPAPAELPKTDLKLLLVGAITDSDPSRASALIEAEKQTRRYYVGDNIPGGAVLHEVKDDSVVLKRENRYETLGFPKAGEGSANQIKTALTGFGVIAPPSVTSPADSAPVAAPKPAPAAGRIETSPTGQVPVARRQEPGRPAGSEKGLTLRERLQRTPRQQQKAPGSE